MRKIQVEAHEWKDYNTARCSTHPSIGKKFVFFKKNGRCKGKNNV
jgi:hypothetical protein